ncbi:MAG: Tyrosine-tRNA ligase [candidate division TM6 bacterium GW2011_GWE2_41_16]|nr:MAG: Tyrosine-tRNA ligase [candidate division TM6 bacterium GW2011_GWE2_41_16]
MTTQQQLELICAGTSSVIPQDELAKKLAKKQVLTIKLGVDPTGSDLHLGHAVALSKLRQLQDLGHEIILLFGTFTARIGDPTGKSKARVPLTPEHITEHMKTYTQQVEKILDMSKVTIRYNGDWFDAFSSKQWIELCSRVTLARIIERDDFAKRLADKQPIALHEILYPVMQGYDSVVLKSDIELGGTDQTFNLLMGRTLQEQYGQEPQVIITMPLLEGLDGVQKMSKSYNNYIGLSESASSAYGKIMSISDELMWRYYQLLLLKTPQEVAQIKQDVADQKIHPMDLKKQLAHGIVERFWSKTEADESQAQFEALFQKRDSCAATDFVLTIDQQQLKLIDLIKMLEPNLSMTQIRRLIADGAISINEIKQSDAMQLVDISERLTSDIVIKVGKHKFFKLK